MKELISKSDLSAARRFLQNDEFGAACGILEGVDATIVSSKSIRCKNTDVQISLYLELLFRTSCYTKLVDIVTICIKDKRWSQIPRVHIYHAWMLYHSNRYQESKSKAKSMVVEQLCTNLQDKAECLRISGMSCLRLGHQVQAFRDLRDSVALYRTEKEPSGQVSSLISLGFAGVAFSKFSAARTAFYEALQLTSTGKHLLRRGEVLHNLAILEYKEGNTQKAILYISEAGAIYKRCGQKLSIIRATIQKSRIELQQCNIENAWGMSRNALSLSQEFQFHREESLSLETLGDIAAAQGKYESAQRYYERAKTIGESIAPEGDLVAENMRRLASLRLLRGEAFESVPLLKEAITFAKKCGERFEIGIAYRHLSQAYRALEQYQQAVAAACESVEIFTSMGARLELAHSRLEAARACRDWYHVLSGSMVVGVCVENPNPYTHLETAWSHAIEAFNAYGDLERPEEQALCEKLMDELHSEGRPVWLRGKRMPTDGQMRINNKPFIATSPAMKQLIALVDVSASTKEPVLVTGETGTGKELIARLIHEKSDRAKKPFVPVNCAAIPESLFEREFFGHARGAYTGADGEQPGLCEAADGGTMFLDEIGDMPAYLQVKLLRMLQEGTFHRLGDPAERRVDLRIIAATNAPLPELIAAGTFRQDLYYRLQTLEMSLPPLRERPEDLEPLIRLFVSKILDDQADPKELFDRDVMTVLEKYPWPGNVRELEAMTRRLALLACHSGRATLEMLPEAMRKWRKLKPMSAGSLHLGAYVEKVERERISQALLIMNGNRSEAARALGISRNQLYRKMDKFGIRMPV